MFNWFRRNYKKNLILTNWDIGNVLEFKKIQNTDSLQYVNEDFSKVIFFSLLTVSGDPFVIDSYKGEPKIVTHDEGWQLKGTKTFKNQILICVISVIKQKDLEWAKAFFNSIKAIQSINNKN